MKTVWIVVVLGLLAFVGAQTAPNPAEAPFLDIGSSLSGDLNTEDGRSFKDGAYTDLFYLSGEAGQAVELSVSSDFDSYLTVYSPDGTLLNSNDDYGEGLDAGMLLSLPQTGDYLIALSGLSEFAYGAYELSAFALELKNGGNIRVPSETMGNFTDDDQVSDEDFSSLTFDRYRIKITDETAGMYIISLSSDLDTYLTVRDMDGNIIDENDDADGLDAGLSIDLAAGNYQIDAGAYTYGETAMYTLNIRPSLLSGTWQGEYTCNDVTRVISLELTETSETSLTAVASITDLASADAEAAPPVLVNYGMYGYFYPDTNEIEFYTDGFANTGDEDLMVSFFGELESEGVMSGTVSAEECSFFDLAKQ